MQEFINDPATNWLTAPENKLCRPAVSIHLAVLWVLLAGAGCLVQTRLLLSACDHFGLEVAPGASSLGRFASVFAVIVLLNGLVLLKYMLLWSIRVYQRYAPSDLRLRCAHEPSCSEYTALALKKHGVWQGGYKSYRRYKRCQPPGEVGGP